MPPIGQQSHVSGTPDLNMPFCQGHLVHFPPDPGWCGRCGGEGSTSVSTTGRRHSHVHRAPRVRICATLDSRDPWCSVGGIEPAIADVNRMRGAGGESGRGKRGDDGGGCVLGQLRRVGVGVSDGGGWIDSV